jgi:hypothetical protein
MKNVVHPIKLFCWPDAVPVPTAYSYRDIPFWNGSMLDHLTANESVAVNQSRSSLTEVITGADPASTFTPFDMADTVSWETNPLPFHDLTEK